MAGDVLKNVPTPCGKWSAVEYDKIPMIKVDIEGKPVLLFATDTAATKEVIMVEVFKKLVALGIEVSAVTSE